MSSSTVVIACGGMCWPLFFTHTVWGVESSFVLLCAVVKC